MIVALLVIISALTISGVAPASECQRNCSNLSIPPAQCLQAFTDAGKAFDHIGSNQARSIGNSKTR